MNIELDISKYLEVNVGDTHEFHMMSRRGLTERFDFAIFKLNDLIESAKLLFSMGGSLHTTRGFLIEATRLYITCQRVLRLRSGRFLQAFFSKYSELMDEKGYVLFDETNLEEEKESEYGEEEFSYVHTHAILPDGEIWVPKDANVSEAFFMEITPYGLLCDIRNKFYYPALDPLYYERSFEETPKPKPKQKQKPKHRRKHKTKPKPKHKGKNNKKKGGGNRRRNR